MGETNKDAASNQLLAEAAEAPPYVLHQHGPPTDEIENLPLYTEQHDPNAPIDLKELNTILSMPDRAKQNDMAVWRRYIDGLGGKQTDPESTVFQQSMFRHFSMAIEAGQEDVIALLIENRFVTANTRLFGWTPLLMAVLQKNVRVVEQLMELGAEPNEFGGPVS
jgi:Ankyrin repeats (3 copies)